MATREKNRRIAIIGAGASGISAALELKKKGYKHIVLFEQQDRIGGKSFSFDYQGKTFDMGSMTFAKDGKVVAMAKKLGVPYSPIESKEIFIDDAEYVSPTEYMLTKFPWTSLAAEYVRFQAILVKTKIMEPGYRRFPDELYQPFAKYARAKKIEALAKAVEPAVTGFGYGYYEEVPAIYMLKFIGSMLQPSLVGSWIAKQHKMCYFPNGWTSFWEKAAEGLEIRTGAEISAIKRDPRKKAVTIIANGVSEVFDALLITSPLNKLDAFLDLTAQEKKLFSRIRHYRIASTLFEASEPLDTGFLVENAHRERIGHVLGFEHYHQGSCCHVAFQIIEPDMDSKTVDRFLKEDVRKLNSKVQKIVFRKEWDYFYHVTTKALKNGFYETLNKLQGTRQTFYLGSVMNFETVDHCQEFAAFVVKNYF